VVHRLYAEAARLTARAAQLASEGCDPKEETSAAAALMKHATASAKANAVRAMLMLARSEAPIAAASGMFDRDHWAMNLENGTLDLRTGELRPHRQSDMITLLAPVAYDPNATCPLWDRSLARVLPDHETRAMLHRFLGYCLTGDVSEQVLVFAFGLGANGKSVCFDVVMAILGDYATRAAPDLVLAKHGESHPTGEADLKGRRLALVSEIDQGRQWDEATIKRITGDTTIKSRKMREDYEEFVATHKLVIYANTQPDVRGTDEGIWRRMKVVPFRVTIPEAERDKALIPKLLAERAGIFAWLVHGCMEWQRVGLGESPEVAAATKLYREDCDVLGEWIAEQCVVLEMAETPTAQLYASYTTWCIKSRREPWKRSTFRNRLLQRHGLTDKRTNADRCIGGIALTMSGSDDPPAGDAVTPDDTEKGSLSRKVHP
jgi:putative DNA primase/helicase